MRDNILHAKHLPIHHERLSHTIFYFNWGTNVWQTPYLPLSAWEKKSSTHYYRTLHFGRLYIPNTLQDYNLAPENWLRSLCNFFLMGIYANCPAFPIIIRYNVMTTEVLLPSLLALHSIVTSWSGLLFRINYPTTNIPSRTYRSNAFIHFIGSS